MRGKNSFVISLLIIILISLADIKFFGFSKVYNFPALIRQGAHNAALALTCLTGYLYFKKKEQWLNTLWLLLYGIEFLLIVIVSLLFKVWDGLLSQSWKVLVAETRLLAEGPLPFLVFYLLHRLVHRLSEQSSGDKK